FLVPTERKTRGRSAQVRLTVLKGETEIADILQIAGVNHIHVVGQSCRAMGDRGATPDHDESHAMFDQKRQEFAEVCGHWLRLTFSSGPMTCLLQFVGES